jgi:hypothetical protein
MTRRIRCFDVACLVAASLALAACGTSARSAATHNDSTTTQEPRSSTSLSFSISIPREQYQTIASVINNPKDGGLYASVGDFIWSNTCGAPRQDFGAPINVATTSGADRLIVTLSPSLHTQFTNALRGGACRTRSIERDFVNATTSNRLHAVVAQEESTWVPSLGYTLPAVEHQFGSYGASVVWHQGSPSKYGQNELSFTSECNLQILGPSDDVAAVEVTCVFSNTESSSSFIQTVRFLNDPLALVFSGSAKGWLEAELHRTLNLVGSGQNLTAHFSDGISVAKYVWTSQTGTMGLYITPTGYAP